MRLVPTTPTGRVDLGPGWATAEYEDGYVHFHTHLSTGGRGNTGTYLKLRPGEALEIARALSAAAGRDADGVA